MKALKRGDTVITEKEGIASIDWKTGQPLTNENWINGPYELIEDYDPNVLDDTNEEIERLRAKLAALESNLEQ